jgi:hypothetical protein
VQVCDQDERNHDGDGVGIDRYMRNLSDPLREDIRQDRFSNPAQAQAGDGNAKLNSVNDFVDILVKALDDARANAPSFDELLDTSLADRHQGEFGRGEEGVGCHQEKDQEDPQQHESDHLKSDFNIQMSVTGGPS